MRRRWSIGSEDWSLRASPFPIFSRSSRTSAAASAALTDLKGAAGSFFSRLEQKLNAHRLRELAPLTLRLAAGRQVKIQYERGKAPWIASRLQDFFGMRETPRIGPNRTPVVLHLLAPSRRPVQTTTDLAGFWERLYPQVRRELMRRYPRHDWSERPNVEFAGYFAAAGCSSGINSTSRMRADAEPGGVSVA